MDLRHLQQCQIASDVLELWDRWMDRTADRKFNHTDKYDINSSLPRPKNVTLQIRKWRNNAMELEKNRKVLCDPQNTNTKIPIYRNICSWSCCWRGVCCGQCSSRRSYDTNQSPSGNTGADSPFPKKRHCPVGQERRQRNKDRRWKHGGNPLLWIYRDIYKAT